MISHSKRFIFTHIPKTAGTSVSSVLSQYGIFLQGKQNFESVYFKHLEACRLKTTMGDEFENYFRFSFVRSPWTWLVSNYEYNRGLHRPFVRKSHYGVYGCIPEWAEKMNFSNWVPWWIETFRPSQCSMLVDADGKLLMNEVYKFESLAYDFEKLCDRLEIVTEGQLPHLIVSSRSKDIREYYDDATRELVAKHFARDFELFGYSTEL
ncbi:MAG: sulfotransferase family 2 domain-containing protein [Gallionella sp.]